MKYLFFAVTLLLISSCSKSTNVDLPEPEQPQHPNPFQGTWFGIYQTFTYYDKNGNELHNKPGVLNETLVIDAANLKYTTKTKAVYKDVTMDWSEKYTYKHTNKSDLFITGSTKNDTLLVGEVNADQIEVFKWEKASGRDVHFLDKNENMQKVHSISTKTLYTKKKIEEPIFKVESNGANYSLNINEYISPENVVNSSEMIESGSQLSLNSRIYKGENVRQFIPTSKFLTKIRVGVKSETNASVHVKVFYRGKMLKEYNTINSIESFFIAGTEY